MVSLSLCRVLFILGLVNAQLDILPGENMGRGTPHLGHTRHRDLVIDNDPMGSQTFSGIVEPNMEPFGQGLVTPDGMVIDLGTENNSPFTNIVGGSRIRLDGRYSPSGELNLGTAKERLGFGVGRKHGDRGLGFIQSITGTVHPRAAGHRHHRGRWARRRFRIGRYSQDSLGGNGGQLAPEETWRDIPVSLIAADQGVPLSAGPGDTISGSIGGP
ncbi:hypothetical protein CHS0354_024864 [Potamilus streckersoni]|uniref:Uncharacterized protein n=1 Tax=Potamilus streckersoni TaxID=2493646 RepID=A0AAE0W062_9BIVA|nr:hypothetical protein CHS0354_024864 [Potamilus streckersoni]